LSAAIARSIATANTHIQTATQLFIKLPPKRLARRNDHRFDTEFFYPLVTPVSISKSISLWDRRSSSPRIL
jgi:hypothetical protein